MSDVTRYGDWSRDRQGWLFGLTGGAWIGLGAAAVPLLLATSAQRWWWAAAWVPICALLTVSVVLPVRGRSLARWLGDLLMRGLGTRMGWTGWQSKAAAGTAADLAQADLPGVLAGIRVHDGPPCGPLQSRPAVVQDLAGRCWSLVASIGHPGIGLAEVADRDQMAAGLSELLEGATTAEIVSALTLQVRTIPDDGAEREAWERRNRRTDAPELAQQVSAALTAALSATAVRHEVFLTVTVPESRIARHARESGGGIDGRARILYGLMGELEGRLLGPMRCTAVTWLDSPSLAAAVRTGFAPGERGGLVEACLSGAAGLPVGAAGPTHAPGAGRRHYEHDAWSSVTAAVLLPDKGAIMGALAPVLAPSEAGERRCLTVFYEPIARARADRLVGRDAMSAGSAAEVRSRMGFQTRAAHRRDAARVHGQDTRLADGKALVRVAAVAAVTVPTTWPIEDFGRRLESAVRGSGFVPLRLDLAQDSGFAAACIPLGVGLPRRRGVR